jgi:protoporphyrinogen oxidase
MLLDTKPGTTIAIIGAGPAGLTAAYLLGKAGNCRVDVFEKDPVHVGGISRTETYKGFHFDIGGHRFFSKSLEVENLWTEILGDELLVRPRSSRIYYKSRFFSYPLKAFDALSKLGFIESCLCIFSYWNAKIFPVKDPRNFEEWISNHFGKRLFRIFFKTYTEKVWGADCKNISSEWAAQRIKGFSLSAAMRNALFSSPALNTGTIKTLIDSFRYPKYGPGQMWQSCKKKAECFGVSFYMGRELKSLEKNASGRWTAGLSTGEFFDNYDHVISTAPLTQLAHSLGTLASPKLQEAASGLRYRDFITVIVILKDNNAFNDNWIYIHDPGVKVGRIQNFKSWSPFMVPDSSMTCYGLEYFCFDGDFLWKSSDESLSSLAKSELEKIGLALPEEIIDTCVIRQPKAYPVYDHQYRQHLDSIKDELNLLDGLIVCGRNGMHKYNNQDHSMMTAMLAVKNILSGKKIYDLWQVNGDAEYLEEGQFQANASGRLVPEIIHGTNLASSAVELENPGRV